MEKIFSTNSDGRAGLAHGRNKPQTIHRKSFDTDHRLNNMKPLEKKIEYPHSLERSKITPEITNQTQFINGLHEKNQNFCLLKTLKKRLYILQTVRKHLQNIHLT